MLLIDKKVRSYLRRGSKQHQFKFGKTMKHQLGNMGLDRAWLSHLINLMGVRVVVEPVHKPQSVQRLWATWPWRWFGCGMLDRWCCHLPVCVRQTILWYIRDRIDGHMGGWKVLTRAYQQVVGAYTMGSLMVSVQIGHCRKVRNFVMSWKDRIQ